jgi:hypothetical protein
MSIRKEIEAAKWPEIYITDVKNTSDSLSFSFLKLRSSKKALTYNYYSFMATGITYLAVTILTEPRGEPGCVEIFDFSTGNCSYAPGFAGMSAGIKGNPFVKDDSSKEMNRLEILFESDSLDVVNLNKTEIFSVGVDFEKMPKIVRCADTLGEFKINLKYRREQAAKKQRNFDFDKLVKVLLSENLIDESKLSKQKLNYQELRQLILESNLSSLIELPVEDIGSDMDAGEHYVELLKLLANNSNGAMQFSNFEFNQENDVIEIKFLLNNKAHCWSLNQTSDHLSEDFIDSFCSLQDELSSGGYLYFEYSDYPQLLFVPRSVYIHFKNQH